MRIKAVQNNNNGIMQKIRSKPNELIPIKPMKNMIIKGTNEYIEIFKQIRVIFPERLISVLFFLKFSFFLSFSPSNILKTINITIFKASYNLFSFLA